MDYVKIMQILSRSSYRGYLPVETIRKDNTYNPFIGVPKMLKELQIAKNEVFKL